MTTVAFSSQDTKGLCSDASASLQGADPDKSLTGFSPDTFSGTNLPLLTFCHSSPCVARQTEPGRPLGAMTAISYSSLGSTLFFFSYYRLNESQNSLWACIRTSCCEVLGIGATGCARLGIHIEPNLYRALGPQTPMPDLETDGQGWEVL